MAFILNENSTKILREGVGGWRYLRETMPGDSKISALTALPSLPSSSALFVVVQGGADYKMTVQQLQEYIGEYALANLLSFVTPEYFGAAGDGTTDDTTAIQNAINSGTPVYFSAKTYYTASGLSVTSNRTLVGAANATLKVDGNYPAITITGANNTIMNMAFYGNGRNSGTPYATTRPNQHGIHIEGNVGLTSEYINNIIYGCRFNNLGGAGYYCKNQVGATHSGNQVTNCVSFGNCWGYFCDTRGEYTKFNQSAAYSNQIGYRLIGGNNSIVSCGITDNVTGVKLESGANDAHSVATGCMINHNTDYSVWSAGITNGFLFSNCAMYASDIFMDACTGTVFDGCLFGEDNVYALNSPVKNKIQNCTFSITPTFSLNANWGTFFNNKYWVSIPAEDINYFEQPALFSGVPTYADNAAALSGGLIAGQIYRTGDDLKIVH